MTVENFLDLMTQEDVPVTIYDMGIEEEACFIDKDDVDEYFLDYEVWSLDVDFYTKTITLNIDTTED